MNLWKKALCTIIYIHEHSGIPLKKGILFFYVVSSLIARCIAHTYIPGTWYEGPVGWPVIPTIPRQQTSKEGPIHTLYWLVELHCCWSACKYIFWCSQHSAIAEMTAVGMLASNEPESKIKLIGFAGSRYLMCMLLCDANESRTANNAFLLPIIDRVRRKLPQAFRALFAFYVRLNMYLHTRGLPSLFTAELGRICCWRYFVQLLILYYAVLYSSIYVPDCCRTVRVQ